MKKLIVFVLLLILLCNLSACGLKESIQNTVKDAFSDTADDDSADTASNMDHINRDDEILDDDNAGDNADGEKINLDEVAENMLAEAEELDSFSTEAADAAMKSLGGLGLEEVKPDFAYILDDDTKGNYGDNSSYGHASFFFIKDGGDVTSEEYQTWLKKVYDATAAVSDDKRNIQGYGFGEGDVEKSFEDVIASDFMQVWSYKYNGTIMDVYPSTEFGSFTVSEDKVYGSDDSGDIGVKIDITVGMQKTWDEYEDDIEEAFDEYGDEIKEALEDYTN